MSEQKNNFICKHCKNSLPISEKAKGRRKCNKCYKEHEKLRKSTTEYKQYRQVYNMINEDIIKEKQIEYNIKKRNDKYGYTEEKIKEINNQWDKMQPIVNEFLEFNFYPPKIYTKTLTPKLKELYMKQFLFLMKTVPLNGGEPIYENHLIKNII